MSGFVLACGAAVAAVGAVAYWMTLIKRVALGQRRWVINTLLGLSGALALAAFAQGTEVVGSVIAGACIAMVVLYFGLLAFAGQSRQAPEVAVGGPLPDFTATDHMGKPFSLSSLTGHPVLLKFFRGHW